MYSDSDDVDLSDEQYAVLNDIRRFLHAFHIVQELVSAEKIPTLAFVLPLYDKLLTLLEDIKKHLPALSFAISASQRKLKEY